MTILTQLFPQAELNYNNFEQQPQPGTDAFGKATFKTLVEFFQASYLNTLALAQEDAMENDHEGLLIIDAFAMMAQMQLDELADNKLAAHLADAARETKDTINQCVLELLTQNRWILWTQDEAQIALNLDTVTARLEAAKAA